MSRPLNAHTLVVGLVGLVLGCADDSEYTLEAGKHIDLVVENGLEPCGDLVGHMDGFISLIAEAWGVDLGGRHYIYRWLSEDTYRRDSGCPAGTLGCAVNDTVHAFSAPVDHELVHLITYAVGSPPDFFLEGAAVAFELPGSFSTGMPSITPIRDILTSDPLPGREYMLAGAYTRHVIDRFGMLSYLKFYKSLELTADADAIGAAHEAAFGEPIDVTIALFDSERRDCHHDRFRFKLFECAAAHIDWEGDELILRRGVSCAEEDVVGPFYTGMIATTYASFSVTEPGLYELTAVSDGTYAKVTLGSCGGCETGPPLEVLFGTGPRRVTLDVGPHYLQFDALADSETLVSIALRRIVTPEP